MSGFNPVATHYLQQLVRDPMGLPLLTGSTTSVHSKEIVEEGVVLV